MAGRTFANPWILLDADTGEVIAQNQATRPSHPASITKLMTAYTVFREVKAGHIELTSPVRISELALSMPPSKMGFPVGTIMTFDNAIKIIMVKSANDVALAIAESAKGSLGAFVKAMNKNAARLKMSGTHFSNPHGLHEPDQVTTARDMALLTLAIQNEFPQYSHYFNMFAIRFGKARMKNHNALIYKYKGTNGMKTGYTCASGLTIVARAKRQGRQLIAVVLGGYSGAERNAKAAQLLSLGFSDNYNGTGRPRLLEIEPVLRQYAIPKNLKPMVCKPNWNEARMTKEQRRAQRKIHLAKLKLLQETFLPDTITVKPAVKIKMGGAFGVNPYSKKLAGGGTPPLTVGTPVWRPDMTAPPGES